MCSALLLGSGKLPGKKLDRNPDLHGPKHKIAEMDNIVDENKARKVDKGVLGPSSFKQSASKGLKSRCPFNEDLMEMTELVISISVESVFQAKEQ